MTWNTEPPKTHGYYLGAWPRWEGSHSYIVSELWFNPDSIGTGWFISRGYLGERDTYHDTVPVVAWTSLPEYTP